MKKLFALVLALSLMLCAVSASAASLGAPFNFTVDNFRLYLETFYSASVNANSLPTWTQNGNTITITAPELSDITLYLNGSGKVTHMVSILSGTTDEMNYDAGTKLGYSSSLMAMSALMAETADVNALQTGAARIEADYNQVLACLENNSATQLANGVSSSGTLMGYPANTFYRVTSSLILSDQYYIEFTLAPMGSTF